ncbi:MAG: hypothetical protein ACI9QD_000226 [Thermoproteota archaeon]|jgi:hypothetical protein
MKSLLAILVLTFSISSFAKVCNPDYGEVTGKPPGVSTEYTKHDTESSCLAHTNAVKFKCNKRSFECLFKDERNRKSSIDAKCRRDEVYVTKDHKCHCKKGRDLINGKCKKPKKTKKYFYCVVKDGKKKVLSFTGTKKDAKKELKTSKKSYDNVGRLKSTESKAENDRRCIDKSKSYVCVVKKGKTKARGILVKDGKLPEVGSKYSIVGTKTFDKKSKAKKDPVCEVTKVKAFVCARKVGKKRVIAIKLKGADRAPEVGSKYEVVGTIKHENRKTAKDDEACAKPEDSLVCYFCDPKSANGDIIKVDQQYAKDNGVENMWKRLTKRQKKCSELKRLQVKKALSKTKYVNLEKLLNDATKYYSKGVLAKLSNEGKNIFKRVVKAPLFDTKEKAKSYYGKFAVEGNTCAPTIIIKKPDSVVLCKETYEKDSQDYKDAVAKEKDKKTKCEGMNSIEGAKSKYDPVTCGCDISYSKALDVKYDGCEYDFAESSFDDVRSLNYDNGSKINGRSDESYAWNTANVIFTGMVGDIKQMVKTGSSCTYSVFGYASDTNVSKGCLKHFNASSKDIANKKIADKRAEEASKKFEDQLSSLGASCSSSSCTGEVIPGKVKANTEQATKNQGFSVKVSCSLK